MRSPRNYRDLQALDKLSHAQLYLRDQFRMEMKLQEAQSNCDARALIFRAQNAILREYGIAVTKDEIDAAVARGRAVRA